MTEHAGRVIVRNTTMFTAALTAQKLLSFVFFIVVARLAGAETTGAYVGALAFTSLFSILVDIGLVQVQIRETARDPRRGEDIANTILTAKIFFALITYLLALLAARAFANLDMNLIVLSGAIMVIDSFILTNFGVLRGFQTLVVESIFTIVGKIITIAVGVFGLILGGGAAALLIAVLAGSAINLLGGGAVLMIKYHVKIRPRFDIPLFKSLLQDAWPFAMLGLATAFYAAQDSVLLNILKGSAAVGYYSIAAKTINALQFIPSAFVAAIYPAMSHFSRHDPARLKLVFTRALHILALIAAPIALGSMVLAREIVTIAYGGDFLPSVSAFALVVPSIFFVFLTFPIGALLNATDRQKTTTVLMIGAVIINGVMNLALIPRWSYYGSALAWFATNVVWCGAGLFITYRLLRLKWGEALELLRPVAAGAVMAVATWYLKSFAPIGMVVAGSVVVYVICAFAFRAVTRDDLVYFISIATKRSAV